jgi:hypothetical protein
MRNNIHVAGSNNFLNLRQVLLASFYDTAAEHGLVGAINTSITAPLGMSLFTRDPVPHYQFELDHIPITL